MYISAGIHTGRGTVEVTESGGGWIVTARPESGYAFVKWRLSSSVNDDYSFETENPLTVEPGSPGGYETLYVNAWFSPSLKPDEPQDKTCNVTTVASPPEGGTTTGDGDYRKGTNCTVSARPAQGYHFVRWSVAGATARRQSHTFLVTGDTRATAYFAQGTGLPLHGSGGSILCGAGGRVLYDG